MPRATPAHERLAYAVHQLPTGLPAAFLSLGQIIALVEKRLRWYGFSDWRVHDVLCERQNTVAVKIRSRDGVVLTISLGRDCGAAEYGIHAPRALARPHHSLVARPAASEPQRARDDGPAPLKTAATHFSDMTAKRRSRRPEISH